MKKQQRPKGVFFAILLYVGVMGASLSAPPAVAGNIVSYFHQMPFLILELGDR